MNILIVAATKEEVNPLLQQLLFVQNNNGNTYTLFSEKKIEVLITGVGMTATAYALGKQLLNKYDLAINAGIAGSFNKKLKIGEVVNIVRDEFSELGAENGDTFLTIDEIGFESSEFQVPSLNFENSLSDSLQKVNGITVNTVHGNDVSIKKIMERLNPDTESMEGAAFMYACTQSNVPHIQIRAISNYIEKRDKSKWNIPLAIKNLNHTLMLILESL